MRSIVTAVIAAIEAAAVACAGLLVVVIPALLLWIIGFNLAAEPGTVFAATAGTWLLAHFVPLEFSLSAEAMAGLGLPQEALSFGMTLAPLGITALTVVLAARSGFRFGGRGGNGVAGVVGGGVGFALVACAVASVADPFIAWPLGAAAAVPMVVYTSASGVAFLVRAFREQHPWWRGCVRQVLRGLESLGVRSATLPAHAVTTLRLATSALVALVLVAALALAAAILLGYGGVTELSQSLHLDPLGSVLMFLLQLALLPVGLVWGASWLTGGGFSVGAGSSVTPFESLLGPLPVLPLFGAIPQGWGAWGVLAPALLVVIGIGLGALFARRDELRRASWAAALAIPVMAALLLGAAVAAACVLASGSIGPDRLQTSGPDPWLVGGLAALEIGCGVLLGVIVGRIDYARLRETWPEAVPAVTRRLSRGSATEAGVDLEIRADPDAGPDLESRVGPATRVDAEVRADPEPVASWGDELDAQSTSDLSAVSGPNEFSEAREPAASSDSDDSDTDALLRAYSWDEREPGVEPTDPEPERGARGWRLPRRKQ